MSQTATPLLLMLGDSLIDYGEWPRRMEGYRVISSGMPGERAGELLRRLPTRLPAGDPDLIVVMSGTNDIFFGSLSFTGTLGVIVATLKDRWPRAEIILTSLLPYRIPGLIDLVHQANDRLRQVCADSGGRYFDLCGEFERSTAMLFDHDGVHLSTHGYRLWAATLDAWVGKLLAKEGG